MSKKCLNLGLEKFHDVNAYKKGARYPFGTVLGEEAFQRGWNFTIFYNKKLSSF